MPGQLSPTQVEAIRHALRASGMTQVQLANALHVHPSNVTRWLGGSKPMTAENVASVEAVLGIALPPTETFELYLSSPITGLAPHDLGPHRDAVSRIAEAAEGNVDGVFWPGRTIRTADDLDAPDLATERNLQSLAQAQAFLYVQFEDLARPSSALIELGLAMGLKIKTTIILDQKLHRPFLLQHGFDGVAQTLPFLPKARVYFVKDVDEAVGLIARGKRNLLGL